MKVVVTGAAGFIGHTLTIALSSRADVTEIVAIDALTSYYDRGLKLANRVRASHPKVTVIEGDLNEIDLSTYLKGASAVFHLAAQPGVRSSWGEGFEEYVLSNVLATQRLLEAALAAGTVERFVYASSSSVYGDSATYPNFEDSPTRPKSPYGVTKLAAEHLVTMYGSSYGLPTISLRFFTVYGPGQRPDMAFNRFIDRGLRGAPIELYGDGEQIREFTHVDDIVSAIMCSWTESPEPGSVVNVSGGTSVSVNETLQAIERAIGARLVIRQLPPQRGDVMRTGGSTDLASRVLGWSPLVSMEDGLRSQVEWQRAEFRRVEGGADD
ncbi:NAD-dependent epimerase/dehydratase family protein [Cellulomonas sp. Leaf334]|uniref:NAD-dependent epimerase/dehydratase family protein n=1 Tax=Cellulomonas sp. Leaf334 TaxID=1736339 RepID=UPI0006FAE941|nr:NAD-dependent epimerase/dehydratase family protein [Cellulomonas sp. Leaf334]KQR12065.1 hypothetical protein ASF78_12895 [Cellulomonas sp. Leaf334]